MKLITILLLLSTSLVVGCSGDGIDSLKSGGNYDLDKYYEEQANATPNTWRI